MVENRVGFCLVVRIKFDRRRTDIIEFEFGDKLVLKVFYFLSFDDFFQPHFVAPFCYVKRGLAVLWQLRGGYLVFYL